MDMLLINPTDNWEDAIRKIIATRIEDKIPNQQTPHMGVAYLMGVAKRHGLNLRYINMELDRVDVDSVLELIVREKPSIVGFTAFTTQVKTAGRIALLIKDRVPETLIGVGGPHAINMPVETLTEFPGFDFVICGEGELLLPQLLDACQDMDKISAINGVVTRKKLKCDAIAIMDLDNLPYPDWASFDLSLYPGTYPHQTQMELPMVASRGCVYRCTFCSRTLGDTDRRRSVASVITEIEHNIETYGCQSIAFLDETFILGQKWISEFMHAMKWRGLNQKVTWSCSTRVSGNSLEFMKELSESGCYYMFFGLESASEETLVRIKKKIRIRDMINSVNWAKEAGILPVGAFIIGLEGETGREVEMAVELGHVLDLYSITFPIATPFPGTQLRELALRGDWGLRLLSSDWDDYSKQGQGLKGVMDSVDFPWEERKRMQKWAYASHPKKKLSEYLKRFKG